MTIAAIKCSAGLNLGNNFINAGGRHVLSTIYNQENDIEYFEFYDSCLPQWATSVHGEILTPSTIEHIRNNHKLIYVFAGSAGGRVMYDHFFKPLNLIGVPFIPIGIGCDGKYEYEDIEAINAIRNLENCVGMVTRDPKTYDFISNKTEVISGIDLAFFAKDYYGNVKQDSDFEYAVINYEPQGSLIPHVVNDLKLQLQSEGFNKIYCIENTVAPSSRKHDNYIQIGYDEDLWRFYANASLIITTRIHTSICAISNEVDFVYLGSHDAGGKKGRNTLFNAIGITLNTNEYYSSIDYQDQINESKLKYINSLKDQLIETQ